MKGLRSFGIALAVLAILGLTGACETGVSHASPGLTHDASIRTKPAEQKHAAVRYWTRARMRSAKPRDPVIASADTTTRVVRSPERAGESGTRAPHLPEPLSARAVDADDSSYPGIVTGKIFAKNRNGHYFCSATIVNARSNNLIFTAAHCVRSQSGGWAKRLVFIPAFRRGEWPFGKWQGRTFYVPRNWSRLTHDYAAVALSRRNGQHIERKVGAAAGFAYGQARDQLFQAFGYPVNFHNGRQMVLCESWTRRLHYRAGSPAPTGIDCNMKGGSSGGGWLIDEGDYLNSVTSYSLKGRPGILYGPYFNKGAWDLFRWAERREAR